MTKLLTPSAKQQFFTDGSTVAASYLLYTYAANTTTPQATYSDRAGAVANANPIVLNARGEATIFLTPGTVYDFVLKTPGGVTVWTQEDVETRNGLGNGYATVTETAPARNGFFVDDTPATSVHKFRDRVMFGDAVDYTGRRTAPYGGDWLTENGASYWMKNAQVAVLGDEIEGRYAFLAAARGGGIGGAFVILNEDGTAGRAIYAEAMHKSNDNASVAIETATSNITATDFNPDAYSMGGARGLYVAAFNGGMGYTVGDADTPTTEATLPPAAAIDIAGYSTTATRWRKGIVFRNGSLYRGTGDGSSGEATAIAMAQGHALVWNSAAGVRGGVVRCDTTTSGQDTGLLLTNNEVQLLGTSEVPLARFTRDAAGAGAVNWPRIINSRTGVNPQIIADGSDTNLGFDIKSKGTGNVRLVDGASAVKFQINSTGIGFFGTTPIAKPAPTGSRGGNAALASLLTQLANLGLITDSTSA